MVRSSATVRRAVDLNPAAPLHMADNPETPEPFSLKRWSQRKRAAAQTAPSPALPTPAVAAPAAMVAADAAPAAVPDAAPPLPPVDSLTFDSDFSAFMQPKIAEETKRAALRKLFSDPSFNVMDGLDIYVGDYTQADPMPLGMLEKLNAAYAMLDPVEPAHDEKTGADEKAGVDENAGASSAATTTDAASVADADLLEAPVTESAAEPAPSTPEPTASDTSPKSGSA